MPDPPVFHFCLLERAGKGRHERQTQLNMVFSGIRERLFWDVGSTQKRRAKGKKGILNLNQMLAKGKVRRYAQAETRREEILLLYIPCLSRASVGLGNGLQRIISGTEASLLHCGQY